MHGRITTRHRGGGHKRRYRLVDFKRRKDGVPAKVHSIEYDPNRSARIALLHYADGEKRYILAPLRLRVGQTVESGEAVDIRPGNAMPLRSMPTGTTVHGVELRPGQGAKMVRSAGGSGPARGQGGRKGAPAAAVRRDAPRPRGVQGDRRPARQRAPTRSSREARRGARAGRAAAPPSAARS